MTKKPRAKPVRAYDGAREAMVELRPTPASGIERDGPWLGQETRSSYPAGRLRRHAANAPWTAPDEPLEALSDEDEPLGIPNTWTPELVRAWLGEAMATIKRMSKKGCFPSRGASGWPEWIRDVRTAYGSDDVVVSQVQDSQRRSPTRVEMARLDIALTWPYQVRDVRHRKAMLAVSMGLDLRTAGRMAGCSKDTARAWAERGFREVAEELNRKARW